MRTRSGLARPGVDRGPREVFVVSGLPRSGTSMMMSLLDAGGIMPLTDFVRSPDDDNPNGYYEFERVKKLPERDYAWLMEAQGKAVKVIAALVTFLPPDHEYAVVLMNRDMDEVLASQRKMLSRNGRATDKIADEDLARKYRRHLFEVKEWLSTQRNVRWLEVNYNEMLTSPGLAIERLASFLGNHVSVEAMLSVIDPALYRHRGDAHRAMGRGPS